MDVSIVGCGISGSICALKLLKEGYNVKIYEKNSTIGIHNQTKIDITENKSLNQIFDDLGIDFVEKSNKTKWFSPNYNFNFTSKISDLYIKRGPEKDSFEHKLAKKILDYGGEINTNSIFKDFIIKNGLVKSIIIENNHQHKTVESDFFVGADGSYSTTLDTSPLKKPNKKIGEKIVGYGCISEHLKIPEKVTYIFFDAKFIPGGYFFISKTKTGIGVACIVSTESMLNKPLQTYYEKFTKSNYTVSHILNNSKILNYFSGSCLTGILGKKSFNNFCLVGDAAYVMDPIFGYGVRQSILSGYAAAESIIESIKKDSNMIIDYDFRLKKNFLSTEYQMHLLKKVFNRLDNDDLDFLLKSTSELHKKNNLDLILDNPKEYLRYILQLILRNPIKSSKIGLKGLLEKINF